MNSVLKRKLENEFSPIGLVAYSGCCRWGCTGSYGGDGQQDFKERKNGIYYIRLHLEGMNYDPDTRSCYANYDAENGNAYEYLIDHWEEECQLLHKFCKIIGLAPDEYTISKPPNGQTGVGIHFKRALGLDDYPEESDDGSDSG